jgi:cell filamentation protein
MSDRYDLASSAEGQFEPGSNNAVLKNLLGITDPAQMETTEFDLLAVLELKLLHEVETDQMITARDLCEWHHRWLGSVYEWAGEYRTVNMTKGDFLFAASHRIPALMQKYEDNFLRRFTPCEEQDDTSLCKALAICHVELIIVHPFREGNGRLARLLATIMALQAGAPLLDFSEMEKHKGRYIEAVHLGHMGDYQPMQRIFSSLFQSSYG